MTTQFNNEWEYKKQQKQLVNSLSEVAVTWDFNDLINKPIPKIGYFTFNSTWNITISGLWFKPKMVHFFYTDQISWYWQWAMTEDYQFAYDIIWSKTETQTECIYLRNWWWNAIWRAVRVSMNEWGFTINVTFAPWTTVRVNYIAN